MPTLPDKSRLALYALAPPLIAILLAGCANTPHEQFRRYGAVAYDEQSGKRGASWDQPTSQRAASVALSQCGASACKVVMRVPPKRCGALATTLDGKGWGVAARMSVEEARLAALGDCAKIKLGECVVRVSDCNK